VINDKKLGINVQENNVNVGWAHDKRVAAQRAPASAFKDAMKIFDK
jgi:hypothetical protein